MKNGELWGMSFAHKIIAWYKINGRELPWRHSNDPYIIWLSEIILQQTRVKQGLPYFNRFVTRFPTVQDFASAHEDDILRLWQGLGYYSRARNMHKAAKMVIEHFAGEFPTAYNDAIALPGVGEYTASAISSFSANEVRAVVDGNVYRVLARVYGIDTPINSSQGKKIFQDLADQLIDPKKPGIFNQAIMDFGATQCKPKQPLCADCIFSSSCIALLKKQVDQLPVKLKGKKSKNRFFHYFILPRNDEIMVSKRSENDVWANLFEFPMIETTERTSIAKLVQSEAYRLHFGATMPVPIGEEIKHMLSHQNIYARFYQMPNEIIVKNKKSQWHYIFSENLAKLAKHKLIFSFLEKLNLTDTP